MSTNPEEEIQSQTAEDLTVDNELAEPQAEAPGRQDNQPAFTDELSIEKDILYHDGDGAPEEK